jgi:hypothetical protein
MCLRHTIGKMPALGKKRPVGGPAARGMGFWKEYARRNLRQQPEWPAQSLNDKGRLPLSLEPPHITSNTSILWVTARFRSMVPRAYPTGTNVLTLTL